MPGFSRRAPSYSQRAPSRARGRNEPENPLSREIVLVDASRLQGIAWADFHTARKRLEKASRDLHRHEQVDTPAYERWVYKTFPTLLTELRQLHEEVASKSAQVNRVQHLAMLTGRSARKIWRDLKAEQADPSSVAADDVGDEEGNPFDAFDSDEDENATESQEPKKLGNGHDEDADDFTSDENDTRGANHRKGADAPASRDGSDAKSIYRRLVQRLHPDRGGDWTDARKRLWNEVQLAWEARDTDWLARLEIEWEANNDALGPDTPLSRLRAAITQILQARRDIERKLRYYRRSPPWRFTLAEEKRDRLERQTEQNFRHDLELLHAQLAYLNQTIAAWERPAGLARTAEFESEPRTRFRRRSSR